MTEDYVSFETAKQLKEKGFDWKCEYCYNLANDNPYSNANYRVSYPKPTLQTTMKWLREVHNIFICILPYEVGAGVMDYTYVLYKIDVKNFYFENLSIQGRAKNISEISYEKTVEAAIKCCLENLI